MFTLSVKTENLIYLSNLVEFGHILGFLSSACGIGNLYALPRICFGVCSGRTKSEWRPNSETEFPGQT